MTCTCNVLLTTELRASQLVRNRINGSTPRSKTTTLNCME